MKLFTIHAVLAAVFIIHAGCTSFHDKAAEASPEEISFEVAKGADVNASGGSFDRTPLMQAITLNPKPYDAARILINAGADVTRKDNLGMTALHLTMNMSMRGERIKIAKLLLENKAPVDAGDLAGNTPLFYAVNGSNALEMAAFLVDHGASVQLRNSSGYSILDEAARVKGNAEVIRFLINKGADVNANNNGWTPLHSAAYYGAPDNIPVLIKSGAKPNIKGNTSESKTPLEMAADVNNIETMQALIDAGADINTQTYYIFKPYRYRNYKQSPGSKLVHGDVTRINYERMTPLTRAVTHKNAAMVKLLLDHKANPNIDAHFGGYSLDFAAYERTADIADMLWKAGGKMIFANIYLYDAIEENDAAWIKLLCKYGAKINEKDDTFGNTPLHAAAESGNVETIKTLLGLGANKTIKNNQGKTPFDIAVNEKTKELLR